MQNEASAVDVQQTDAVRELPYKRPLDLAILVTAHIVLLPAWLLIWVLIPPLIWLEDRGSIFYRQARVGLNGQPFLLWKFRSMVRDAENIGAGWTSDKDPRVTRVGRLMRRTAIDELPQILNILRGDISFVGPRALPLQMHQEATREESRFPQRLRVRPGLTGLAQLYLPRHCSPRRRLRYDLLYLSKRSFWLDFRIIFFSALNTLTGKWGSGFRMPEDSSRS